MFKKQEYFHSRAEWEGFYLWWNHQGSCDVVCEVCRNSLPEEKKTWVNIDATWDQEADTPLHCDWCHRPLKGKLTSDGVDYVVEALEDDLAKGRWGMDMYSAIGDILPWYQGSPRYSVRADWVELLKWHGPNDEIQELIDQWEAEVERVENSLGYWLYWSAQTIKRSLT